VGAGAGAGGTQWDGARGRSRRRRRGAGGGLTPRPQAGLGGERAVWLEAKRVGDKGEEAAEVARRVKEGEGGGTGVGAGGERALHNWAGGGDGEERCAGSDDEQGEEPKRGIGGDGRLPAGRKGEGEKN